MDKDNERILLANVIGECIKSLQLDKNINQKELALLSGVSKRSLRRLERGQVQAVSYSILIQYNFTQTKRPEVRKNTGFRSFFVQNVSGNLAQPFRLLTALASTSPFRGDIKDSRNTNLRKYVELLYAPCKGAGIATGDD